MPTTDPARPLRGPYDTKHNWIGQGVGAVCGSLLLLGILKLIPYAGPWISAVPACLMALLLSPAHVLGVLGLYLFLHVLEGYVLLPIVQRRAVLMSPALTLVMQVLLGELLGQKHPPENICRTPNV